jgi:hypothetical protein
MKINTNFQIVSNDYMVVLIFPCDFLSLFSLFPPQHYRPSNGTYWFILCQYLQGLLRPWADSVTEGPE